MEFDVALYMPDDTVLFAIDDGTDCGQFVARLPYSECADYPVVELVKRNGRLQQRLKL